jgi:large subunit ribosomal protein L18
MRDKSIIKQKKHLKKKKRIRKHINGTGEIPRLAVHRSLKNIYVQLVDDSQNRTLIGTSSLVHSVKEQHEGKSKTEIAQLVGLDIAEKAKNMNINKVVFDRGGYLYHGRVKSLAEGARKGGLVF